jgi:hypothetical protein
MATAPIAGPGDQRPRILFGDMPRPTVVCRTSQAKDRVEFQADLYALCLLMPRKLDDRFHEPDHGTGDLLVDSSFAVR